MTSDKAASPALDVQRVNLELILHHYRPGSGEWSWAEEFAQCIEHESDKMVNLIRSMAEQGFRLPTDDEEPVTLGDDLRVWEGHHRILAAWCCQFVAIPCAFGTGGIHDAT